MSTFDEYYEESDEEEPLINLDDIDSVLERFASDASIASALNDTGDGTPNGGVQQTLNKLSSELSAAEAECIKLYESKGGEIATLSAGIDDADGVLASLQEMLLGFQADLGGISTEIKQLQDESITMGVRLRNRRAAEGKLRRFIERVVISPEMVEVICGVRVGGVGGGGAWKMSHKFVECIGEVEEKFEYVSLREAASDGSSGDVAVGETKAGKEVKSHLEKLRLKGVMRTRE